MSDADPLPGLETPARSPGPLETAVRRTVAALNERGYVDEASSARLALALELAQIITDKRRSGRTSTVGNDARVLVELLDDLLPAETETDDRLQAAIRQWSEYLAEGAGS